MSRVLVLSLCLSMGCMKSYVHRAASIDPREPMDALLVGAQVRTIQDQSVGEGASDDGFAALAIVEAANDAVANSRVDEFGATVVDRLTPFLVSQGFRPIFDAELAKSTRSVDWGEAINAVRALSGSYSDPRASSLWVQPRMLFRRNVQEKTAAALAVGDDTALLYLTVTVYESRRLLVMRLPMLQATAVATDHAGVDLLKAQGIGRGDMSFLIIDRSPANLGIVLDEAMMALSAAPVETIDD
ncbi:MAG: hypothetical protein VX265_14795 [Myxococcota bacterium]|nr:hypothetical protein [Myxococcota bacterium]